MTRWFILVGSQVDLAFRLVPNLECRVVDARLVTAYNFFVLEVVSRPRAR
jgi:hypothetical protein